MPTALPDKRQFIGGAVAALLLPSAAAAKTIIDMAGNPVVVPPVIRRVYIAHDPPAIFMTSLAPDLMVGMSFPLPPAARPYLPPAVTRLPLVGGTSRISPERLLTLGIDVALVWNIRGSPDEFADQLHAMNIPAVMVNASSCREYPAAFRFLGRLLNRQARAEQLAGAMEKMARNLDETVGRIPQGQRLRVYYADSADGLLSECATAFRGGEEIEMAGGHNVLPCTVPDSMTASVGVNLERLLALDPDVVVARTHRTAHLIQSDPGWRSLRAVQDKKVYAYPELPFNWAERPHSQLKFLAIQWLAWKLYPHFYRFDFARATRDFFRLFYDRELTDADIARLG